MSDEATYLLKFADGADKVRWTAFAKANGVTLADVIRKGVEQLMNPLVTMATVTPVTAVRGSLTRSFDPDDIPPEHVKEPQPVRQPVIPSKTSLSDLVDAGLLQTGRTMYKPGSLMKQKAKK